MKRIMGKLIVVFLIVFLGVGLLFVPVPENTKNIVLGDIDDEDSIYFAAEVTFDAALLDENGVVVTYLDEVVAQPYLVQSMMDLSGDKVTAISFHIYWSVDIRNIEDYTLTAGLYWVNPDTEKMELIQTKRLLAISSSVARFSYVFISNYYDAISPQEENTTRTRVFALRFLFECHDTNESVEGIAVMAITLVPDHLSLAVVDTEDSWWMEVIPDWVRNFVLFDILEEARIFMEDLWGDYFDAGGYQSTIGSGETIELNPLAKLGLVALFATVFVAILDRNSSMRRIFKSIQQNIGSRL